MGFLSQITKQTKHSHFYMYYKCSFLLLGIFLCLHVFCRTHPTQIARHSFQELLTMFEVPVSESHPCLLLSLSAGGSYSINPTFKLKHLVVVGGQTQTPGCCWETGFPWFLFKTIEDVYNRSDPTFALKSAEPKQIGRNNGLFQNLKSRST